ncbi:MAG: YwmB family TATA-box binding protein, partial [Clostridiales bacterium]|nr:YwmB family TATA-box binding protein [Clostridiales bacterium]
LLVSVAAKNDIEEFPALCRTLLSAAKGQKEAELKCLIVGSFPGRLERGDLEGRISSAFAAAGARFVEQAQGGNYISRTGYVPSSPHHLLSGQKKVNLQMAGDYSESEQKTYIYLGSPLIFDDY